MVGALGIIGRLQSDLSMSLLVEAVQAEPQQSLTLDRKGEGKTYDVRRAVMFLKTGELVKDCRGGRSCYGPVSFESLRKIHV